MPEKFVTRLNVFYLLAAFKRISNVSQSRSDVLVFVSAFACVHFSRIGLDFSPKIVTRQALIA